MGVDSRAGAVRLELAVRSNLTAAWGWAGANFWRAAFDRITAMQHGGNLRLGSVELDYVCAQLIIALVCLAIGVRLVTADSAEVTA